MTPAPQASTLYALREAGLLSPEQVGRALAHPLSGELAGHADPVDCLVWLVRHEIVSEERLQQACADRAATSTGEAFQSDVKTLVGALRVLDGMRDNLNKERFDALVAEDLITPAERDRALQRVASENIPVSPAAALAWMALSGLIGDTRLSAAAVESATGSTRRAEILAEASDIHAGTRADLKNAAIDASFPGPRWLWFTAPVLVTALVIWIATRPATVPGCTDPEVADTVKTMMFKLNIAALVTNVRRSFLLSPPTLVVHDIEEVGLAKQTGIRGCLAKVGMGDEDIPYAFTIAPVKSDKGTYMVTGADPAIVRARFGHLDARGAFLNQAEPIGRAEVERAFRDGADSLDTGRPAAGREPDGDSVRSYLAPERLREVAEIEPMGPCREVKAGTVYRCRLLVERNEAPEAVQGNSHMLIDSAFTFERDGATGPWRVSAGFADEYARAVTAARLKAAAP